MKSSAQRLSIDQPAVSQLITLTRYGTDGFDVVAALLQLDAGLTAVHCVNQFCLAINLDSSK